MMHEFVDLPQLTINEIRETVTSNLVASVTTTTTTATTATAATNNVHYVYVQDAKVHIISASATSCQQQIRSFLPKHVYSQY